MTVTEALSAVPGSRLQRLPYGLVAVVGTVEVDGGAGVLRGPVAGGYVAGFYYAGPANVGHSLGRYRASGDVDDLGAWYSDLGYFWGLVDRWARGAILTGRGWTG